MQQRTTAEGPQERKGAIILLDIAFPDSGASKVVGDQGAVAVEEKDQVAVGRRRGRREVTATVPA